jgi:NADH:ubiquinone oxidoreductase subunit 3 (subunit A)
MLLYIGIFLVGFFYVWKKGVLDWGETAKGREKI